MDESPSALIFLLLGLGGTVAGLVVFDVIWKQRFRGVRRPLVHGKPRPVRPLAQVGRGEG
jgi:hypothetical protein